jgi:hypothetical protein
MKSNQKSMSIHSRFLKTLMALLSLFAFSCRELVQDKFPDFDPVPTVNAILIADEPIQISVSMAQKIDTMALKPVEHALVLLTTNGLQTDTLTFDSESGMYVCDELAKAGNTYRCEVQLDNYKPLVAETSIPQPMALDSVQHIRHGGRDEEGVVFPTVKVTFRTQPGQRQYFEVYLSDGYLIYITDPVILNEGLPVALFSNELITDSVYTLSLNVETGGASDRGEGFYVRMDPYIVEVRSVHADYYRYMKQRYLYQLGIEGDGYTSPVAAFPLYSNVQNGYGIFTGYSKAVSDTIDTRVR